MPSFPIIRVFAALAVLAAPVWGRTWADSQGHTIDGAWIGVSDQGVALRRPDGTVITVPLRELSAADQEYVAKQLAATSPSKLSFGQLNDLLGTALFASDNLWGDNAGETGARLHLAPEAQTTNDQTFRTIFFARSRDPDSLVLGVPSWMAALKAHQGAPTEYQAMFANRGNYPDLVHRGDPNFVPHTPEELEEAEQHRRRAEQERTQLDAALQADLKAVTARLTKTLGPARQDTGTGRLAGDQVDYIWTWKRHTLVVSFVPGELVEFKVEPVAAAKPPAPDPEKLAARWKSRVIRESNGDQIIAQIPLAIVDRQGYYLAATMESFLRDAQIQSDEYELAMMGGADFSGANRAEKILQPYLTEARRNVESREFESAVADLETVFAEGRLLLWNYSASPEFQALAVQHGKMRAGATAKWSEWQDEAIALGSQEAEDLRVALIKSATPQHLGITLGGIAPIIELIPHLSLITGYDRVTGELAFTDLAGDPNAEHWIPLAVAREISIRAWDVER